MSVFAIARSGVDVEWRRLEVIAANLANASTASTPGKPTFQPLSLVSGPAPDFRHQVSNSLGTQSVAGVSVLGVTPRGGAPRLVHEPGNPLADKDGYVAYPAIDQAMEMTLMIKTARVYEADLAVMSIAGRLFNKAFDLGKSQ